MASVRRKPASRYWFACYTDSDGIQRQRSTRMTDRRLAQDVAESYERAYSARQTEFQIRRVLSDIHEKVHGRPLESTTLQAYAKRYLERVKGEVEPTTYSTYKNAIDEFERFAVRERKWLDPMNNVSKADIEKFRDEAAAKATARTANNKLKILRILFRAAWSDSIISDNPAAKVKALKAEKGIRRGFTMDELKRLMKMARKVDREWAGIITFGFYVGPRIKDIALLTTRSIDLKRGIVKFSTSKTGRSMSVPLAAPLVKWLKKNLPPGDSAPLFPKAYAIMKRTGNSAQLSAKFAAIMSAAKLVEPRPPKNTSQGIGRAGKRRRNELVFHSLRHTITTQMKMSGIPEAVVRDIVGHESAAVSEEYTHADDAAKRTAVDSLPDIT